LILTLRIIRFGHRYMYLPCEPPDKRSEPKCDE
jgi:hypothetical protein